MALIKCKECGAQISSTAANCPHCGYKTEYGNSQTQSIVDLISLLLLFAGVCLGIYWFLANIQTVVHIAELLENYDAYSEYYGVLEYLEYKFADEAVAALWQFVAGVVLIICGLVGMRSLKKEVEKRKKASVRVISSYYQTESNQAQNTTTAVRWECPQCHHTNPPAAQTCTRCGTARPPEKTTPAEDTITCPECGDVHIKGTIFCTGCGTKL